jgi:CelD/BcsL family acetyltransferase involved in cellulose biosynthesis
MSLTVLNVAYPFARVSPDTAGGAEQVLAMLDDALAEAGHTSIVIAPEGSTCRGRLIPFLAPSVKLDEDLCSAARAEYRQIIRETVSRFSPDIIHFHGIDFDSYELNGSLPTAVTLHLPPGWYAPGVFRQNTRHNHLICVSQSQARTCPSAAHIHAVIENGIRLAQFHPAREKGNYVLALGRICPEKGFHLAMDAAARRGLKLVLAGTVFNYPSHRDYFENFIRPRLNMGHEFIGAVGGREKARLLARAKCLLIPSLAPETSSLVAMEAMASGTPVIAFRAGALNELVDDGRTGFVVSEAEGMWAAMAHVDEIDPEECRQEAERRFSSQRMTAEYLALYQRMTETKTQSIFLAHPPRSCFSIRELTNVDEIAAIAVEWRNLYSRCEYATPFQRPEWLLTWIKCFRPSSPMVVETRRNGQLVALAPMLIYNRGRERVLGFMGGGVSDYLDVLFDPTFSSETLELFSNWLRADPGRWDYVEMTDLSPQSPLQSFAGIASSKSEHDVCPVITIPGEVTDLGAIIPSRQFRNLRNARARLLRAGKSRFEIAQADNFESMLDALFRLHALRWREEGGPGVLADSAVQTFHRIAGPLLLKRRVLRMHGLRLEERYIAVLYSLVDRGRVYCYLQGFDPECHLLSPGTLILGRVLEDALSLGVHHVDLLRGSEAYKYAWGARNVPTSRVTLRQPSRTTQEERILA